MTVIVRKTESGYSWQPSGGRAYPIDLLKILPDRAKQRILAAYKDTDKPVLTWRYYQYIKGTGLLFLSDNKF